MAEHVPDDRRGYYTSFIQITATAGFFVSLLVILATRLSLGEETFSAWGWRLPFLLSIVLVAISLWIRLSLRESPLFARLKEEGKSSRAPLSNVLKVPFVTANTVMAVALALGAPFFVLFGALSDRIGPTGNAYAGLFYPMTVGAVTFLVGAFLVRETHRNSIWAEVGGEAAVPAVRSAVAPPSGSPVPGEPA